MTKAELKAQLKAAEYKLQHYLSLIDHYNLNVLTNAELLTYYNDKIKYLKERLNDR